MSLATTLGQHLPYLRRFARALTGSQHAGDAFASEVLETISADPSVLDPELDPRTALFRLFIKIWLPMTRDVGFDARVDLGSAADRNLEAMTPLPRAAFLLHSMESLAIPKVAAALDVTSEEAERLIEQANFLVVGL